MPAYAYIYLSTWKVWDVNLFALHHAASGHVECLLLLTQQVL